MVGGGEWGTYAASTIASASVKENESVGGCEKSSFRAETPTLREETDFAESDAGQKERGECV